MDSIKIGLPCIKRSPGKQDQHGYIAVNIEATQEVTIAWLTNPISSRVYVDSIKPYSDQKEGIFLLNNFLEIDEKTAEWLLQSNNKQIIEVLVGFKDGSKSQLESVG
jgi:hypothetical protein